MNENVTITVTYGPNEDEIIPNKDDYWKELNFAIQNSKDKLIIVGDLNARIWRRNGESSFVVENQAENVRNENG